MQALTYRIDSPSVIFERFDGELVAIHLDTGAYHSLFGAAADAFSLLVEEATVDDLAEALQRKYDASSTAIAAALVPFLAALDAEKLIVTVAQGGPRRPLSLEAEEPRLPFTPPTLEAYHDLQGLFLLDPVHEVGDQGWPQPIQSSPSADESQP
jgi:hypothetical protein